MAKLPPELEEKLRPLLTAIARLFKAPLITIIVRSPDVSNVVGDLVLSNDNPTRVIVALRAQMVAEAKVFAGDAREMTVSVKERSGAPEPPPGARSYPLPNTHLKRH